MESKAHVLILGKHPSLTRRVLGTLEAAGFTGRGARTDREAIELAGGERFDVLLIGGGVPWDEHHRAIDGVVGALPEIRVIRRPPSTSTDPVSLVEEALTSA